MKSERNLKRILVTSAGGTKAINFVKCLRMMACKRKHLNILDVGSGTPSPGHVFFRGTNIVHIDIDKSGFSIDVQCDAHKLPFADDSFDIVYISHVLEHVHHPYDVLKEIKRVTKKYAIVKVPNASHYRLFNESDEHIYGWTPYNLENLLKRFFQRVEISLGYRITFTPSETKFKRKMHTLKIYLIALFFGKNEIIAICGK